MSNNIFGASMAFTSKDKAGFFDRPDVIARIGKGKGKALGRAAATCRKKIQQGMLRAKSNKPSRPGKPPKQRMAGNDGLRKIFYSLDMQTDTVRLSVLRYNRKTNVPSLHEFGGQLPTTFDVLGPTKDTAWMFEPALRNRAVKKQLAYWQRNPNRSRMQINANKRSYGVEAFTQTLVTATANYPKRSYMQTGLEKYMKSKHFQARVAEILKG